MKVSLNTIKQYIDFELPPVDELVKRINEQLGGVDEVIDLADKYKDAKIVRVVECEKHPNADRLSVCRVDAGTGELIQVVCGAPNVQADMWAVWLPPESIVPSTYGAADEFKLGARELRGVMSNGMLAAADELAIGSDHEGILEIDPDEWKPSSEKIVPGASFAKIYGLDDAIIDIENKMFTHRPDLFGQLGVAREIAGILGQKFSSPNWYMDAPKFEDGSGLELEVFNEAEEKVPRVMFVAMKNVEIKPSPLWLQCALVAMGSKPINNIVDVTNYVMLLTAQPTHAYDYDKIRGGRIGARMARAGEKIELLNGKTYELTEDDIVIADAGGAIGLGGIMGGGNSEVSPDTKNIILEVATFDMYAVRKSAMRHGVFTDALTRFNKGQSPLQNDRIINLLLRSVKDVSPAEQASDVFDRQSFDVADWHYNLRNDAEMFDQVAVNARLGLKLSDDEMLQLLNNVEISTCEDCADDDHQDDLHVFVPFWRTDISQMEDIVEEVGRLYGFDKLPRELPTRSTKPAPKNQLRELKQSLRETLSRAGANEVLTYSFEHEKTLQNAGQDSSHAYKLSNALSPDLQYYRLSIVPSLLDKVRMNYRAGYEQFALFELGKTHFKGAMDADEPAVPNEDNHIGFVLAYGDKQKPEGAPYYAARRYLEQIVDLDSVEIMALKDFDVSVNEQDAQFVAPYDKNRSAVIVKSRRVYGVVGEFNQAVRRAFKLPDFTAGFELRLDLIKPAGHTYKPLSRYPSVSRDISFKVPSSTAYEQIIKLAEKGLADTAIDFSIAPLDIYQADGEDAKTVTIGVSLTSHDKTLSSDEVNEIIEKLTASVVSKTGAEVL